MRFTLTVLAGLFLSGCGPQVPDSGTGVGFGDYEEYESERQARDAELSGSLPRPDEVSSEPLSATGPDVFADSEAGAEGADDSDDSDDIAAQARRALEETSGDSAGSEETAPETPPRTVSGESGISEENDFGAVEAERTIESDAELIARNREQYRIIEPEDLPARPSDTGPNIVAYALETDHPRGTQLYRRGGLNSESRYQRNCAEYASSDQAQADFLERGGPRRDRLGLDPDGDGYACSWDPAPYRRASGG